MDTLPERKSIRLKGYDYHNVGEYFVTVVTQERKTLFGNIENGNIILSTQGKMIDETICEMPKQLSGLEIIQYVVMPNHIHLLLGKHNNKTNLAEIIKWLKSTTALRYYYGVKEHNWPPYHNRLWQRNYYEHIVRNQQAHDFIAQYIHDNPMRWHLDALNAKCITPEKIMKTVLSLEQPNETTNKNTQ